MLLYLWCCSFSEFVAIGLYFEGKESSDKALQMMSQMSALASALSSLVEPSNDRNGSRLPIYLFTIVTN